ncbi:MAG TPA: AI-2E family transporter [Hanamia sp.]|nr:AI-2E family transporter [Hanamia sp.]
MKELPVTVRRAIELVGLFFLGMIIVAGKGVIMPLFTAVYLSIVLLPAYRFFKKRKFPETLSIGLALLLLFIGVAFIVWFFSSQISRLIADLPRIKENVMLHLNSLSSWINAKTNFSTEKQLQLIDEQSNNLLNNAGGMLTGAAASLSSIFIFVGLLPIYIFLILYYRNLLMRFIFYWFPQKDHARVGEGLRETEGIIKSYLVGLLIQICYITILLGGALMILGIKHALLIGVIFAILNLIPYVGALVGNVIGVLLTLTSSQELGPIFTVLITIAIVQFLDNNILMPRIVGSKVKINALASIIGVLIGGSLAGIAGMFLSLPTIAVLKIIFDRTDNLKQWGVLLGDEVPKQSPLYLSILKIKDRKLNKNVKQ